MSWCTWVRAQRVLPERELEQTVAVAVVAGVPTYRGEEAVDTTPLHRRRHARRLMPIAAVGLVRVCCVVRARDIVLKVAPRIRGQHVARRAERVPVGVKIALVRAARPIVANHSSKTPRGIVDAQCDAPDRGRRAIHLVGRRRNRPGNLGEPHPAIVLAELHHAEGLGGVVDEIVRVRARSGGEVASVRAVPRFVAAARIEAGQVTRPTAKDPVVNPVDDLGSARGWILKDAAGAGEGVHVGD